jgi:Fe-S cluster assembly protein SufD
VFISKDSMNVDNNITVVHNASHTTSDVCFKGIASGKSSATFNAKAIVQKGLVAIKALQSNKNLLLDKTATINTKPELEIYSDDVVCSHGATIGQLDKNLIFYFQSRGISYNEAITMLTVAFLIDILERQSLNGSQKEKFSVQIEDYSSKIIS